MLWEWSHSPEAYDYARAFLRSQVSIEDLAVIAAEWDTHAHCEADEDAPAFDQEFYHARLAHYTDAVYSADVLAELIWDKMSELRSATVGGHAFWGCPYGCDCHLIPAGGDEELDTEF